MVNNKNRVARRKRPLVRRQNGWNAYIQPTSAIHKVRLSVGFLLTTSGGGHIYSAQPLTPSSFPEFSNYAALYDEFRMMGGTVTMFTVAEVVTSSSSPTNGVCAIAYDFNDSTVPTSVNDVLPLGNRRLFQCLSLDRNGFVYDFRVPTSGPNTSVLWYSTTATPNLGSIKFAASTMTASRDYMEGILDIYVEFRGRI